MVAEKSGRGVELCVQFAFFLASFYASQFITTQKKTTMWLTTMTMTTTTTATTTTTTRLAKNNARPGHAPDIQDTLPEPTTIKMTM